MNVMAVNMMGYGWSAGMYGAALLGLVYFALAAFIFSIIFWLTYSWIIKDKKK